MGDFDSFWPKNLEKIKKSKIRFLQFFCPIFVYLWPENQVSGPKIEGGDVKSIFFKARFGAIFKHMLKRRKSKILSSPLKTSQSTSSMPKHVKAAHRTRQSRPKHIEHVKIHRACQNTTNTSKYVEHVKAH